MNLNLPAGPYIITGINVDETDRGRATKQHIQVNK